MGRSGKRRGWIFAIATIVMVCGPASAQRATPASGAPTTALPEQLRTAIREQSDLCRKVSGKAGSPAQSTLRTDINADGRLDLLYFSGAFSCPDNAALFAPTAAAGVPTSLYLGQADGTAKLVWEADTWGWDSNDVGGFVSYTFDMSGMACGDRRGARVAVVDRLNCTLQLRPDAAGVWGLRPMPGNKPVRIGATRRAASPKRAAVPPPPPTTPPEPIPFNQASLGLCGGNSPATCDFVLLHPAGPAAAAACATKTAVAFICFDDAIKLAEAVAHSEVYAIFFDDGSEPAPLAHGRLPVDRFYRTAWLKKDRKGVWKQAGSMPLGGILSCPDYRLSSLVPKPVLVGTTIVTTVTYVRCDVENDGRFTFRDRRLVGNPPFLRPGTGDDVPGNAPAPLNTTAVGPIPTRTVTATGRARILVEPGRGCSEQAMLLRGYCFDEAIDRLERDPKQKDVTVILTSQAWTLGSRIGRGQFQYVEVKRRDGGGYKADRDLHGYARIQPPNNCFDTRVLNEGFVVTAAGGRKVAVEVADYTCGASLPR